MEIPPQITDKIILDVGCGEHCLPNAIGIDIFQPKNNSSVLVHDLNQDPWPLPDHQFQNIRCQHVIEHIANLQVLAREMYRVSANGAKINFITPHYSSGASWGDPTHRWHFALGSIPMLFSQVVGDKNFKVISNGLKFTGSVVEFPGWLIYKLSRKSYEKHFAWIFPANEIHTTIEIIK